MTRVERLATARFRRARMFDLPFGFLLGIGLMLALLYPLANRGTADIAQIHRVYACVGTNGSVTVRAYTPPCTRGQVVSWGVKGQP